MTSATDMSLGLAVPARTESRRWGPTLATLVLALAAVLASHAATVESAVSVWLRSNTYTYAWVVLPTLAYVLWHNRRRLAVLPVTGSAWGIVAAALCGLAWIAADWLNISEGRQLALIGGIAAVVLAAVGPAAFRALMPSLALLVFLVPTGRFLINPLKHLLIAVQQTVAGLAGLPFKRDGFTFAVGPNDYVIIDDCTGLPYLLVGLFLGLSLSLLIYRSWWRIAVLTLAGGALGVLANMLRITSIVVYDYATNSELTLTEHGYFEMPAVLLCFGALMMVFARLRHEPAGVSGPEEAGPARRSRGPVVPGLLAMALLTAGPLMNRLGAQSADMAADNVVALPASMAHWTKLDGAPDWRPSTALPESAAVAAAYGRDGRRMSLFVAEARWHGDKISGAVVDLTHDGARSYGGEEILSACAPKSPGAATGTCRDVRHIRLVLYGSKAVRHIYTVFTVGDGSMVSTLQFRLRRAWAALNGDAETARMIAIASDETPGLNPTELGALFAALL
jgi:exosortase